MMIVRGTTDCGNSPKNLFVQRVAVALVSGEFIADAFAEGALWRHPSGVIESRSAIGEWLAQQHQPDEVTIAHAISHGRVGAASGTLVLDGQACRFAFVFEFTSTKANVVSRIESYE